VMRFRLSGCVQNPARQRQLTTVGTGIETDFGAGTCWTLVQQTGLGLHGLVVSSPTEEIAAYVLYLGTIVCIDRVICF
jgi:hypothetical protein